MMSYGAMKAQAHKDCEGENQQEVAKQACAKACSENARMSCDFKMWSNKN